MVAGLSTGGYVAAMLAGRAPERVAALALCDTTTRSGPPDVPADRLAVADDLDQHGIGAVLDSVAEGLGPHAGPSWPAGGRDDPVAGPGGVAWVCRALAARPDTSAAVRDLPAPVLLLFGEHDGPTPPEHRLAQLHRLRPDATSVVVPGSGHLTALEAPAEVAAALAELAGGSRPGEQTSHTSSPVVDVMYVSGVPARRAALASSDRTSAGRAPPRRHRWMETPVTSVATPGLENAPTTHPGCWPGWPRWRS